MLMDKRVLRQTYNFILCKIRMGFFHLEGVENGKQPWFRILYLNIIELPLSDNYENLLKFSSLNIQVKFFRVRKEDQKFPC